MPRRSNDDNLGRDKKTMTTGIMGVFYENPNKEFNYKQISTKLGYTEIKRSDEFVYYAKER